MSGVIFLCYQSIGVGHTVTDDSTSVRTCFKCSKSGHYVSRMSH